MRARRLHRGRCRCAGVVLFITLVTLVIMSIGVIVLIRAVQDNNSSAGNLAFRQATAQAAELGAQNAVATLTSLHLALEADATAHGYFAAVADLAASRVPVAARWTNLPCRDLAGAVVLCDVAAYRLQTMIERLCSQAPVTDAMTQCIGGDPRDTGSKKSSAPALDSLSTILYRITVRVRGPRNAESLVQTVVAW